MFSPVIVLTIFYLTSITVEAEKAILVTGGGPSSSKKSVEVLRSDGSYFCTLDDLPDRRAAHSMDQELLCGGGLWPTSCLKYESGRWTEYSWSLQQGRAYHLSWRRPNNGGVQLVGGFGSSIKTTETVSSSGSLTSFQLEDAARYACGIQHVEFFVITGGEGTWSKVRRYAEDGTMDNLPNLKTGRAQHGCGHYFSDSNELVFLVTGGYSENEDYLKTTEIMSPGGDWKYVDELSSPRYGLQGITVDNNLFMTGGQSDYRTYLADILKFDIAKEEWVKIGEMSKARTNHALTQVPLSEVENYCQ